MTKTSPATHLLRELHVLTTPVVLFLALATANLWGTKIGPSLLLGTFSTLFAVATVTFVLIAILRTRKLPIKVGILSALVSGFVNATVVTSLVLAFRIWYFQWPFNQEPIQPEDYIDDGGAAWLITIGLAFLGSLIWVLGIFAVGSTPTKAKQKAESLS
jgi:magnesium-transporting ATPase (P-type)